MKKICTQTLKNLKKTSGNPVHVQLSITIYVLAFFKYK